jgi:hypothetical protein
MGYFIDPQNNYPRHAGDIQLYYPNWNEEIDDLPQGWQQVDAGIVPEFDPLTQKLIELQPLEINGKLTRQFEVLAIN